MKVKKTKLLKPIKNLESKDKLPASLQDEPVDRDLAINEQILREEFKKCSDVVFRPIKDDGMTRMFLVYIDGLIDKKEVDQVVLKPIFFEGIPNGLEKIGTLSEIIEKQLVAFTQTKIVTEIKEVIEGILKANLAIFIEGESKALIADIKGFEKRAIAEPVEEIVVRGPRDGFTETLRTNTVLIRRRIQSPKLKMEPMSVGQFSKTDIVVTYIEGIVQESVLKEVRKRLKEIKIDAVIETGYLEEFIEDTPHTPFPTVQHTERPDVVCASLLEGKVAILVDNTPFVLIVPYTFWSGLQAAEDYYERSMYVTFVRLIRVILFNTALFFPSFYVALTTFHPQLIPTSLLISIAGAREGVPFPSVIEAFLMEFMFEGLREAGIRLPRPVGSAVSIVGALVIGEAAVQAGIISAPVVIVVSTTGIASFAIPRYNMGIPYRLLRFPMLFLAGMMGLYGIAFGAIMIFIHLVNLRSFGIPYLTPVAPQNIGGFKDLFWRAPRWRMTQRPNLMAGLNKERVPKGQKPSPKRGKDAE